MSEYTEQAEEFLRKHDATISIKFNRCAKYFDDDTEERNVYDVILTRGNDSYEFQFGDSIMNTEEMHRIKAGARFHGGAMLPSEKKAIEELTPSAYDVLSCLEKYEPPHDTFQFAEEYGYEIHNRADFRQVDRILEKVEKEYSNISRLFGDCMDELAEIQ
jgi:hypothetical protein